MWNNIVCKNKEEEVAKAEIIRCEKRMKYCYDSEKLWELFITADDLWEQYFEEPWEIMDVKGRTPDHQRIFTARQKFLEENAPLIAIYGNVTINGDVIINGKGVK